MTRQPLAGSRARSGPWRRRGLAALGAGILLTLTACGGDSDDGTGLGGDGAGPGSGDTDGDGGGVTETALEPPENVCDLVDIAALQAALASDSFAQEPTDYPKGYGFEPGGMQCVARINYPPYNPAFEYTAATMDLAVIDMPTAGEADEQFDQRVTQYQDKDGAESQPVDGAWDQATLITISSRGSTMNYAVAQHDNLVLVVNVIGPAQSYFTHDVPFTQDDVTTAVTVMLADLDTAVIALNEQ